MARMMPAYCPDSAPPGERAVYGALATGADTHGWCVLHSLGIADHVRQVEGEADFVVIVPGKGLLVIEVKSHRSVNLLDDGRWQLGNDRPTERGPFQQAKEAMYSIRRYLERRQVDLRSIPVLYAVWFTHVRARTMLPNSPEWHGWQILDSEDLRVGAPDAVCRSLAAGNAHLETRIGNFGLGEVGPDEATVGKIASVLRPRFEMHVVAGDVRRSRRSELINFIGEQYRALDSMAENQSVLFTGPAGSGKTLLAIEAGRREVAQGRRGRLLCFNRLLGLRLAHELRDVIGVSVGTFHQELLLLAGMQAPLDAGSVFWDQELPNRAIDRLLEGDDVLGRVFLIVDEVQDIARDSYLDVLDLLVDGGLQSGRVLLFGDFERQSIFDTSDGRPLLRATCPRLTINRLTANCRNLPRIGYVVNTFSQLEPGFEHFRRQDDGVDPTFVAYEADTDQSAKVVESIRRLREEGFDLNEITVLSPLRSGSTSEITTDKWLRQVLSPADGALPKPGRLQYSTIQAFKGLESPAVVLTDLDRHRVAHFESLLYIGMTRATDRLFVLIESTTIRFALGGAP